MHPDRWEHGSDYAWPDVNLGPASPWLPPSATYWHSGRDALRALVRALRPRRVLFPSFYCQEVLDVAEEAEVVAYGDGPDRLLTDVRSLDLTPGDLVVVTNPFGLRRATPFQGTTPDGVTVVEDHTHDPLSTWARTSNATYAFASLRKWFPLPDGGMLWSPAGRTTVDAPVFDMRVHARSAATTLARLSGMLVKQRYLAGENVSKDVYRAQSIAGEEAIGRGEPAPMSPVSRAVLDVLPAMAWRESRSRNHQAFADALQRTPSAKKYVRLLTNNDGVGSTPFTILLAFETSAMRDAVRTHLVGERIYPAVLWPIDAARAAGIPAAHVDLSKRILCLHCDHRYGSDDMERVAGAVVRGMEATV